MRPHDFKGTGRPVRREAMNETSEAMTRRVVREELAGLLAEFADVSETGVYRAEDSIEIGAYDAFGKAAEYVAQRLACPHNRIQRWTGTPRCADCGSRRIEEENETDA